MAFGFFNRKRKHNLSHNEPAVSPTADAQDTDFPQLSVTAAQNMCHELREQFAQHQVKIEITNNSALITDSAGAATHLSLGALASNVAGLADAAQLPELVDKFVKGALEDASASTLSTADLYRSLRLRLLPTPTDQEDGLERQIRENSVLREFTSDTSVAIVLDTKHAIKLQPLAELEQFDSMATLERAAERNTWQELVDATVDATYVSNDDEGEGANFWAFESSSYFLGSAALFLPDFLAQYAPQLDQDQGVIFAIPDRDLMLARPVTAGENLMNGISAMVRITMRFGLGNATSISPRLHLLHNNEISTFTDFQIFGESTASDAPPFGAVGVEVRPDPYLMEMLQRGGFDFPDDDDEPDEA